MLNQSGGFLPLIAHAIVSALRGMLEKVIHKKLTA